MSDRRFNFQPSNQLLVGLGIALAAEHVLLLVSPFNVLHPVDPHVYGRMMLHGRIPYRDFQFEYPPLAALAFVLPGLLPGSLGMPAMCFQAITLELIVVATVLRHHPGAVLRYAVLSLLVFPFLSGGFDAFPMAAIALSTAWLAAGQAAGWWVAAWGAATKLVPGVTWVWGRTSIRTAILAAASALIVLSVPLLIARHTNYSYIDYSLHRGVEAESLGASSAWMVQRIEGQSTRIVYEFRSNELSGAAGASDVWFALGLVALVLLAFRAGWRANVDPWLASFVAVLIFLCGSKVLSPQYIAWPAPLAAVLGRRWFLAWLAVAALTYGTYAFGSSNSSLLTWSLLRNVALAATTGAGLVTLLRRGSNQPSPGVVDLPT